MAKSKLQYINTSGNWTDANTVDSENALINVTIEDTIGNPRLAKVTLSNIALAPFGAGSNKYGPLTTVFNPDNAGGGNTTESFVRVRIIETETNVTLFEGRVYDYKDKRASSYGPIIEITAKDALAELSEIPTDDKSVPIVGLQDTTTGAASNILTSSVVAVDAINVTYTTGTAVQVGSTITGSGTTWTDAMVGTEFSFDATASGGGTITARATNTSITVDTSASVGSGNYKIAGINSTETSIIVDNVDRFAAAYDSVTSTILIGSEQMTISSIASSTLTVVRGRNGTTPVAHADNALIYALTFTCDDGTQFSAGQRIKIGSEEMDIKSIGGTSNGDTITLLNRGANGTFGNIANHADDTDIIGLEHRSTIIKKIIRDPASSPHHSSLMVDTANIVTDDPQKFEISTRSFNKDGIDTNFNIDALGKQGLNVINAIAKNEPHSNDDSNSKLNAFGYDYYVDSQSDYVTAGHMAAQDFNFFKRGTRSKYSSNTAHFKGLTVEYGDTLSTETGLKYQMLPQYKFDKPKRDLYTGAVVKIEHKIEADGKTSNRNVALEFELIKITALSAELKHKEENSNSAWEGTKLSKYRGDGVSTNGAVASTIQTSSGVVVGRLQYVDGISGTCYALISFEPDTVTNATINTQKKNFEALSGSNTGMETYDGSATFTYHAEQGRMKKRLGIKKPLRISGNETETKDVDSLRRKIYNTLARTQTIHTDSLVRTIQPPYTYFDTYAISSTTTTAVLADDTNGVEGLCDAWDYGVRAGMMCAKIDSNGDQTAYGTVTAIYPQAVTEDDGNNQQSITSRQTNSTGISIDYLNTGNLSGYTGSSNKLRFYIPVRASHYIRTKNEQANVDEYQFVKKIIYTEGIGMQNTQYEGTGVAANQAEGLGVLTTGTNKAIAAVENKTTKEENPPISTLPVRFEGIDATKNAKFIPTGYQTITWTAGKLIINEADVYPIKSGTTSSLTTDVDTITKVPKMNRIYFDPNQNPDGSGDYTFEVGLEETVKDNVNVKSLARVRASDMGAGGSEDDVYNRALLKSSVLDGLAIDPAGTDEVKAPVPEVQITNPTANSDGSGGVAAQNSVVLKSAATGTTNQTIHFPPAVGTANQILEIASVTGTVATMGWATAGAGDITGVTLTADDSGTAADASGNVDLTIAGGTNITTSATSSTLTINGPAIDDTPVNGETAEPISSNWAYDHLNNATAHQGAIHTHSSSAHATVNNLYVNNNIEHVSDTNTYVEMGTDNIDIIVGGTRALDCNPISVGGNAYVGINSTGDSGMTLGGLKVGGDFHATNDISCAGDLSYAGTLTDTSDSRVKTNIVDFSNANSLALIDSLQPRTFKKLDADGNAVDILRYGLVAQEVETVLTGLSIDKTKSGIIKLPDTETVEVTDDDGNTQTVVNPRKISYVDLIAPLIGAIKELKARIIALES